MHDDRHLYTPWYESGTTPASELEDIERVVNQMLREKRANEE